MIDEDRPNAFGYTVFCDEIRMEISGKLILIGVYYGQMLVNQDFPITLPRFSFSIAFSQKREQFSPKLKLQAFVPGDTAEPSIEAEIHETAEGAIATEADRTSESIPEAERKYVSIFSNLTFDNFKLVSEGTIKVRMIVGDKRYNIGNLQVRRSPQMSSASASA